MSKRILITGAAGFIGRYAALEFALHGWHVIGMGPGKWDDWSLYGLSEWHCCEVTIDALVGCVGELDVILHCAGGSSVASSIEEPHKNFINTVDSVAQVLEFIRLYAPQTKLIYPSSAAVYGQVKELPISEDTLSNPVSPYGIQKKMAELLCELYAKEFKVSIKVLRLFSVYGEGLRKQLLWDACEKFNNRNNMFFGTGKEVRDWLHVNDVAKLFVTLANDRDHSYLVMNVGSGQGVSVEDVLCFMSNLLVLDLKPKFSSVPRAGDPDAYVADVTKANSFNWKASIDWYEGVERYVDWYKQCH